jgi:hypothetical protein
MSALARRLSDWRRAMVLGVGRFPVSLVALTVFMVLANLDIAEIYDIDEEMLFRAAALSGGAATIAAAVVLFGERRGIALPLRHTASLAAALIVASAMWFWKPLGVAPPALLVACLVAMPLAPYVGVGHAGFWTFVWRLVFAATLALVAVIVFCAGLSAILLSLDYLFEIAVDDSIYGHVWLIGLGFVGPAFALALIPTAVPDRDAPERGNFLVASLLILCDFVAVPLVVVYALILHAYALKIIVSGEVPRNQLGWMVVSFGLATLTLRMIAHPLRVIGRPPTRLFLLVWPYLLLVPLALLGFAAWERIAAYGLTPERYLLALFALLLALVLVTQIDRRWRDDIRLIPALGMAALLFASVGPWGMIQSSAMWQAARVVESLRVAGALDDEGRLASVPKWEFAPASDVQSIVWLLDGFGQLGQLRSIFNGTPNDPFAPEAGASSELAARIVAALNVDQLPYPEDTTGYYWIPPTQSSAVVLAGYDVVAPGLTWGTSSLRVLAEPAIRIEMTPLAMTIDVGTERVVVSAEMLRAAIDRRVAEIAAAKPGELQPPFFVELTLQNRRLGLLMESVSGRSNLSEFALSSALVDLYIDRADWR